MAMRVAVQGLCQMLDGCPGIRVALMPMADMGCIQGFPSVDDGSVYQKVEHCLEVGETKRDYYKVVFHCWDLTMLELFDQKEVDHE